MKIVLSILAMLLMLSVMTVVHEFGHYIVARLLKVRVIEFSVFMGPKIFTRTSKKTGIKYSLRWLPIGGYCAFSGEEQDEGPDSFYAQPWYKRALILVAGATMNILLALITVVIIFAISGYTTTEISQVKTGYPVSLTDISDGDKLVEYDGKFLLNMDDYTIFHEYDTDNRMVYTVKKSTGEKVRYAFVTNSETRNDNTESVFTVEVYKVVDKNDIYSGKAQAIQRKDSLDVTIEYEDGRKEEYYYTFTFNNETGYAENTSLAFKQTDASGNVTEKQVETDDTDVTVRLYSFNKIGFSFTFAEKRNFFGVLWNSMKYLVSMVRTIIYSIIWLITGTVGLGSVMGPVGLTALVSDVVGAQANVGSKILTLANMMALISVNLGVFNLLPFPALDGGKLFLILIELIRGGKRMKPEHEGLISLIGFIILILLAIVIAGKDIVALFNK